MRCTALSVVKGTEISSFDVEILDTIAPEQGLTGPRLLIRVSGPAVAATGVGPGFSGSPIYCDGRNAGAISEAIGDYGNFVVLATPIEEILADAPAPTPRGRPRCRAAGTPGATAGRPADGLRPLPPIAAGCWHASPSGPDARCSPPRPGRSAAFPPRSCARVRP